MFVEEDYIKKYCKPATPDCCRYLLMGPRGWCCGKLDVAAKMLLDARVAKGDMNAVGDNCGGKILVKNFLMEGE